MYSYFTRSCRLGLARGTSHHPCASAWPWLRAIPSESLGLTLSGHGVCDCPSILAWYSSSFLASVRCSFGTVIDSFSDLILGCGNGPLRIRLIQ